MIYHGEEKTISTKVPTGAIYIKRVKYCSAHGWIDLFYCGGAAAWETQHTRCNQLDKAHDISPVLPEVTKKAV